MNILDLAERELLRELENDNVLLAQTNSELRRPQTQEYYKFLMELVAFKYDLAELKRCPTESELNTGEKTSGLPTSSEKPTRAPQEN